MDDYLTAADVAQVRALHASDPYHRMRAWDLGGERHAVATIDRLVFFARCICEQWPGYAASIGASAFLHAYDAKPTLAPDPREVLAGLRAKIVVMQVTINNALTQLKELSNANA